LRSDLDKLMRDYRLDAIVAFGSASDPAFNYLTAGSDVQDAMFTKTRGEKANIWLGVLEREGVKSQDFVTHIWDRALYHRVFSETGSRDKAELEIYFPGLEFLEKGIKRVALYGRMEFSFCCLLRNELNRRYPGLEIVDDETPTLVDRLRATKSGEELAKIAEVARKTSRVMVETRDYIRSHKISDNCFINTDRSPLTVADVKRFTRSRLFEQDLEASEGMIFAPGKQAIVGHNTGEPDTQILLGVPIIFDLFPRQPKGYYHDATRTWCFGSASECLLKLYQDVRGCFDFVVDKAAPGISSGGLQGLACDYFRERGYPVVKDNPNTVDGYTHALGHGVGLAVHETPVMGIADKDVLSKGNVFAIEPSLIDTKRGLAVRIEDTFYVNNDGKAVSITDVPYDLVIPVK
jgi:Xaa-Pro aminopeptidase